MGTPVEGNTRPGMDWREESKRPANRMIINVRYGGNADGAARYIAGAAKEEGRDVPGTEDRATLLGSQGFGFPVHDHDDVLLALAVLRRDVELQASNTKPVENTVIHASMSWPQGYEPSRKEMLEAAEHLAKAWGMEAHRRISWRHSETKHRHVHTIFGWIYPDTGYAHHDHELNDRAQRAALTWEREHGIPPARQKDHEKAAAAEASDHARTMELSKNIDGSISRRSLDRALSLGGWFGPDKVAQRKEFIIQNDLTKFPRHRPRAYSPKEVAAEKQDYIRRNRELSSNLACAYDREAKKRASGVFRLYEDHSFEKTSKPPVQEEKERGMGIMNDLLDWPWKKIGVTKFTDKVQDWRDERRYRGVEVQRHNDTTVYPNWFNKREIERYKDYEKRSADRNRDFGKEVEKKGWYHPEVKQQWEKKYGQKREESRDRPRTPEEVIREMKIDEGRKEAQPEHARLKNWEIQRERRAKEEKRAVPRDNTPPWRRDEERSSAYRRQKELEQEERDSKPPEETRLQKHWREQQAKPRPEHYVPLPGTNPQRQQQTPALPPPRETPMPTLNADPRDQVYRPQQGRAPQARETKWDKEFREREREGKAERRFQDGVDQQEPKPKWRDLPPEQPQGKEEPKAMSKEDTRDYGTSEGKLRDSLPGDNPGTRKTIEENWKRDLDKINNELGKEQAEREEQGRELPRSPGPSEETIERMNKDAIEREERKMPPHRRPFEPDRSLDQGRLTGRVYDALDRLDPPTPAQARDDLNASSGPADPRTGRDLWEHSRFPEKKERPGAQSFRDQLSESLKDIKPPKREIGKDRER